ncbi:MAG: TetR/AcrR family transcriptional regulator [Actinobacteria bacterium]|nr:TetR/AcrR family transcriptional regulator [Actinomycetota bacterium]
MTPTQAERSEATRGALLRAGRELFAERGFANTPREDIVERAGVTRGALHHHFGRKEDLFRAVCEEIEEEIGQLVITAAAAGEDPMAQLRRGCQAFLDAALEPAVQRIVVLDAPAVLGWEGWREVEARHGLGLVGEGLRAVMAAGQIDEQPVEPLAHIVLAALNEAALLVAGAQDPAATRVTVGRMLDRLLFRL